MPILHMETDVVRGVSNHLQQTADLLFEHTQQINTTIQSLSSNWQGPSANLYISDIHPVLQQLNQLFDAGTTLNHRLQREVDEWEQVDSSLVSSYPTELNKEGKSNSSRDISNEYAQKLLTDHWANLSQEERMEFIGNYIEEICREYGIPIPKIQFMHNDKMRTSGAQGEYSDYPILDELVRGKIGSLSIPLPLEENPLDVLETAAHETRHAMQHYYVEHPDRISYDQISGKPLISEQQLNDWKYNFEHPVNLEDFEKLPQSERSELLRKYGDQSIEIDAREFENQYFDRYLKDFKAHEERGNVMITA